MVRFNHCLMFAVCMNTPKPLGHRLFILVTCFGVNFYQFNWFKAPSACLSIKEQKKRSETAESGYKIHIAATTLKPLTDEMY